MFTYKVGDIVYTSYFPSSIGWDNLRNSFTFEGRRYIKARIVKVRGHDNYIITFPDYPGRGWNVAADYPDIPAGVMGWNVDSNCLVKRTPSYKDSNSLEFFPLETAKKRARRSRC